MESINISKHELVVAFLEAHAQTWSSNSLSSPLADAPSQRLLMPDPQLKYQPFFPAEEDMPEGGTTIEAAQQLSDNNMKSVNWEIGRLLRWSSCHISPTGKFGDAGDLLTEGMKWPLASYCWSGAFQILMERWLRTAELRFVHLPYNSIRHFCILFAPLLDEVKQPRLVVVNAADDANVIISKANTSQADSVNTESRASGEHPNHERKSKNDDETGMEFQVVGLKSWQHCIFGDPLMGFASTKGDKSDIWKGFEGEDATDGAIEDRDNAHIRMLLYDCYQAVLSIVLEFVRQATTLDRELEARARLLQALNRLAEIEME